jgi:hypothetical protein
MLRVELLIFTFSPRNIQTDKTGRPHTNVHKLQYTISCLHIPQHLTMKLSPVLGLIGATVAQLAVMQKAIGNIQTALGQLDTAVKGLSSDPNSAAPVLQASQGAGTVIKQATSDITASQTLSLQDALSLQNVANSLTTAVQTTVSDLAGKKAVLDQLGVTSVAVQTLQQQKTDSAALGKAIVSKVPAIGQNIAQQSIDKINTAIDDGIKTLSAGGNATKATRRRMMRHAPVEVN